jgi:Heparinase II/III-like protein/Heparinase II/III N-terminus
MLKKISLYYHTLKYLRPVQFQYRAYYFVRSKWRKITRFKYDFTKKVNKKQAISLENSVIQHENWLSGNEFQFLNQKHDFKNDINWDFGDFGKLWTYNLCYFEFLEQKTINKTDSLRLIQDFIEKLPNLKNANEPFPTALRLMYWTKFLVKNKICDIAIDESFWAQAHILADNLEYHILGNHLLEDGFGLLFAAYYFQDDALYEKAQRIITDELNEEILADGGHFELSPMYHQHILFRVLDGINLIKNNTFFKNNQLLPLLTQKAEIMLGWLAQMTFQNGDIPMLNDSAPNIAPTSAQLFAYAKQLHIEKKNVPLHESGYRKYENDRLEVIYDIGNIGADYILGHAHSDTFNFVVYIDNQPFIVDTGISTYESNAARQHERSTAAHNTVMVNGQEQSEVWGGFRVARRAKIVDSFEDFPFVSATHDGYKNLNIAHRRTFKFMSMQHFSFADFVYKNENINDITDNWKAFIHFYPNIKIVEITQTIQNKRIYTNCITNIGTVSFWALEDDMPIAIHIEQYDFCDGFNKTENAQKIVINGIKSVISTLITPNLA